ncbi:MAG: tetratricopeptide repeat-containing sensor histidine kinase [Cyclobacteriaceae bacterium]
MRTILVIFSIVVVLHCSIGQDVTTLQNKLNSGKLSTKDSILTLQTLSRDLAFVNPTKSLEYANYCLSMSTRIGYPEGIANAYRILSAVYSFNESYFISMEYLQRSLDIFKTLNDSIGIANCYISLGHTCRRLRQREDEIRYHKTSYEIFTKLDIKDRLGVTSHNLGESYYNVGELQKARELTRLAIFMNDSINNRPVLSSCYKVMALIEFAEGNFEEAKSNFYRVLEISDSLGENSQKVATTEAMLGLAHVFKAEGNLEMQMKFLVQAAEFSEENHLAGFLKSIFQELLEVSIENGDHAATLKYLRLNQSVRDSLNVRQLRDRYNLTKTVAKIHELSKDKRGLETQNSLQSDQLQIRTLLVIVVVIFLLILLMLLLKFLRLNSSLNARNRLTESQNRDLETLNNTKDKFFSIVAHDLKNPLISLNSFSSLLIDNLDDLSKEQISEMGKEIKSSVSNTIKMAENLITWAMIQMKEYQYKPETVKIESLTSHIFSVYNDVAIQKGVRLGVEVDDDLVVTGDKNQLEFILRNLVNNAVKFTKAGGTVDIKAHRSAKNEIEISVADSGIGIPKEKQNKLFDLGNFYSLNGTAGEKGTGLGLMLCHEFLKLNKAEIEVESELDKGSVFTVIFKSNPKP